MDDRGSNGVILYSVALLTETNTALTRSRAVFMAMLHGVAARHNTVIYQFYLLEKSIPEL